MQLHVCLAGMAKPKCKFYETGVCKCGKHEGRDLLGGEPLLGVSQEAIKSDLTVELPQWKLSSYAPGNAKVPLISNRDVSPEEMRWQAYMARDQKATDKYVKLEKEYEDVLKKQRKDILADLKGATEYIMHCLQESLPARVQNHSSAARAPPIQSSPGRQSSTLPNVPAFRRPSLTHEQRRGSASGPTSSLGSNVSMPPAGPTPQINGTYPAKPLGTLFGSGQQTLQISGPDSRLPQNVQGTRMEDVPQEIMDMFKMDHFETGRIPVVPPPWEVC